MLAACPVPRDRVARGEAGVGKSRLAGEFGARAAGAVWVLSGITWS